MFRAQTIPPEPGSLQSTPAWLDAGELALAIRRRRLSPVEAVDDVLARISRLDPLLNAYIAVFADHARTASRRAEQKLSRGRQPGPLFGVPLSVKDLILTTEGPTTAGSRIFGNGVPGDNDADVVWRLRRSGAILLGKTNLHEVALGVTSVNEHFGPVRNPWDTSRMCGGSSGGSAVAVAAGLGALSVGSDTRGSIRIPAACCGVTGLKPTYGLVSLGGVLPLSPSLDHVGPMARSVADCALMLGAMTRGDAERWTRAARRAVRHLRIGVCDYYLDGLEAEVARAVEEAIGSLRRLGCDVRRVELPELADAQQASVVISASQAIQIHDRHLRENSAGYGPRVRQRLEAAYRWTALDYLRALDVRARVAAAFDRVFGQVDCLVGAVVPVPAPSLETLEIEAGGRKESIVDAFTRLNSPQNLAGIPALALPCGSSSDGLPIGWQFMAARGRDEVVLALGGAYQRETDWHRRRPPVG